ncbi:NADH dehydrogenase [compost metagenome]
MTATRPETEMDMLEQLLKQRRSCRAFLPEPVPNALIHRLLSAAQRTASWCNSQPWQVVVTRGEGTRRLREALQAAVRERAAPTPDFPFPREYRGVYQDRRRESGFQLYGALGIARGDKEAYAHQAARNFMLFDAPHVAIVTSDEALGTYGAVDCGAYVANFLNAAEALGLGAIAQAALAMQAPVLREVLQLDAERRVVCGISFGLADKEHPANGFRTTRAAVDEAVRFIDV